jgi:hypothetical protein
MASSIFHLKAKIIYAYLIPANRKHQEPSPFFFSYTLTFYVDVNLMKSNCIWLIVHEKCINILCYFSFSQDDQKIKRKVFFFKKLINIAKET